MRTPKSRLGARGATAAGPAFNSISAPNPFAQSQQSNPFAQSQQPTFAQPQQATFAPPNASFTFGDTASQMSFGQTTSQAPTPVVFGQNTSQSAPSSFSAGPPSQANNGPAFSFGSNNMETTHTVADMPVPSQQSEQRSQQPPQTNGSGFGFGLNNNTATPQSAPSMFSFSRPAQTGESSFGGFGVNNNNGAPQPTPAPFAFGQPAQANGTTSIFGSSNNTQATPSSTSTLFGQPAQANGATTSFSSNNNFGVTTAATSSNSFGQSTQMNGTTPSFGTNNNNASLASGSTEFSFAQPTQTNRPIFGFGTKTNTSQSAPQPSLFTQKAQTQEPATSGFRFDSPSKSASTSDLGQSAQTEDTMMFSPPRTAVRPNFFQSQPSPSTADPAPELVTAPVMPSPPPLSDTEHEQATTSSSTPAPEPPNATPTASFAQDLPPAKKKSLFQTLPPTSAPTESLSKDLPPASAPVKKSLFQTLPPTSTPTKSLFQTMPPTSAPAKSLFQTSSPFESQELASTTAPPQEPPTPVSPARETVGQRESAQSSAPENASTRMSTQAPALVQFEKVRIRTHGPSEPLTTGDPSKWLEHDRKSRLLALNKQLLERLSKHKADSQDFENVIIYYYQTREKLGLMWPSGAKTAKRKAESDDFEADRASPSKKARGNETLGDNTNTTSNTISSAVTSTIGTLTQSTNNKPAPSVFDQSNSGQGGINGTFASSNSGSSKPYKGPTSNTSNLFQSIISDEPAPTTPSKSKSPFASVPTQPQSATKALFSFSQPEIAKVTSPAKPVSPPTSDEVEEGDDVDEQSSEDEENADADNEDQGEEEQSGSDSDSSSDDEEMEETQSSKPENVGKSLFDRIQPPSAASGDSGVTTPIGTQDKLMLKQPAPNHSFKPFTPFTSGFAKSTPQAPTVSPITPFAGSVKSKPMATFEFTPKVPVTTPTPMPGASIFAGGSIKLNGPIPGEGLFGSRPSTPNPDESTSTNVFAGFAKTPHATVDPSKDNTWSRGSPLKFDTPQKAAGVGVSLGPADSTKRNFMAAFGETAEKAVEEAAKAAKAAEKYNDLGSDAEADEIEEWEKTYEEKQRAKRAKTTTVSAFGQGGFKPAVAQVDAATEKSSTPPPSFSITAATPSKDNESSTKFSNLFGQKSDTSSSAPPATNPVGFSFGPASTSGLASSSASALQPAASYLFASANTSGLSSRATSPGATDNESVGTDGEADATNDPQTSLMSGRTGEENEEVLYEVRAKALKYMNAAAAAKEKGSKADDWNSVGLGILRVLKNKDTGKSRIVIRAEPGANVLLNTHLAPFISYINDTPARGPGVAGSGVVRFGVPVEKDKIERWVLKVKSEEKAEHLARVLTENKDSTSS